MADSAFAQGMKVVNGLPRVDDFCHLWHELGWGPVAAETVERAFAASLASVSVLEDGALRAFARVVGDGALYMYIQDVMVAPSYQRCGLGTLVVERLVVMLRPQLEDGAFIGLLAVPGTEAFYRRLGFALQTPEHSTMQLTFPNSQGDACGEYRKAG